VNPPRSAWLIPDPRRVKYMPYVVCQLPMSPEAKQTSHLAWRTVAVCLIPMP
jgi:hypothetical protein